jgi:hypothetical protein
MHFRLWLYSSQTLSSITHLHEPKTAHRINLGDDEQPLRLLRLLPDRQLQHIALGRNGFWHFQGYLQLSYHLSQCSTACFQDWCFVRSKAKETVQCLCGFDA